MLRDSRRPVPAHVIVLGNEKGGSGKSTTAMHIIVGLLKTGARVASIDTDGRQSTLTRYIENRAVWAQRTGAPLELPTHFNVPPAEGETVTDIEDREFRAFAEAISRTEYGYDFVVVDTAGSNSYLMRVSHAMADTLVTPINDSFVDFDVIGRIEPETYDVIGPSHYAELVQESLRQRALVDDKQCDWVIVRNRLSTLKSRNQRHLTRGLEQLRARLGFRLGEGITERPVYREFFPRGLTALDRLDKTTFGVEPTMSHLSARDEILRLLAFLGLPSTAPAAPREAIGEPAQTRPAARPDQRPTPDSLHGSG
ncbi:MAG: division plane positioning ATPase MipZ [Alphaproteobacteria bacterium]